MESSGDMDQLEKIMQELDATHAESHSSSPQPKELPHRPIILASEIKDEPVDSSTEATASAATTNEHTQITARNANNDGTTQSTPSATDATSTEGSENREYAAVAAPPIQAETNEAAVGSATELQHAGVTTATSHVPLAAAIEIKAERVDEDGEVSDDFVSHFQNKSKNNEPVTSSVIHTEEGEILDEVKSEPVNASGDTLSANTPPPSSMNMKAAQQPTRNNLTAMLGANYNTEVGDHELDETLPDNFFDDLLQDADDITAAALQATSEPVKPHDVQANAVKPRMKTEPLDSTSAPEVTQSALIPDNFFDDLLVDHAAERIDDVVNQGLEVKYSERLKELEELECEEHRSHKAHKKHKKKKKKSHKRSHTETVGDEEPVVSTQKRSKRSSPIHSSSSTSGVATRTHSKSPTTPPTRIRVKSEFFEIPKSPPRSGSLFPHAAALPFPTIPEPVNIVNLDEEEPETSAAAAKRVMQPKPNRIRVKTEFAAFPTLIAPPAVVDEEPDICLPVQENELFQRRSSNNANGLIIDMTTPLGFKRIKLEKDVEKPNNKTANIVLPKDKMQHAKQRAIAAIEEFKKANKQESDRLPEFLYTATVRKLPNSSSYYTQQIYENRSPLHNVNNVLYKFNSHANRFNLQEWGLEEMPSVAVKVAKALGFDAHALDEKLKTVKMPLKLQKIKKEFMEQQADENEVQMQTSFLVTVATQTNEVTVLEAAAARRKTGHDIAVQAMPVGSSTGTQTTGAPTTTSYDDLPLMQHIKTLNENQLMALSDFAELILEPAPATGASAMDLYRLRQRMMDIYKCAQLPSELATASKLPPRQLTPQPTPANMQHIRDPRIDRMAMVNESPPPPPPRKVHAAYPNQLPNPRILAPPLPHRPPVMPPHLRDQLASSSSPPQKIPVISNVQSFHPSAALQPPLDTLPGSSKYYGRGGLRRTTTTMLPHGK